MKNEDLKLYRIQSIGTSLVFVIVILFGLVFMKAFAVGEDATRSHGAGLTAGVDNSVVAFE